MPTISSFYGIFIRMYSRDHAPAHFHAIYQGHEAFVAIETGDVIEGRLRRVAASLFGTGHWRTETSFAIIGAVRAPVSRSSASRDSTMIKVVSVEHLGGHRLRVRFSDASFGEHDFSVMVTETGSMLEPLRDPSYFARVFLEFGAPTGRTASTLRRSGCAVRWRPPASSAATRPEAPFGMGGKK